MGSQRRAGDKEISLVQSKPSSSSPNMFQWFLLSLPVASMANDGCTLTLTPNIQNVVSRHLLGSWTLDKDLTNRTRPSYIESIPTDKDIIWTFDNNTEVLDNIPNSICRKITGPMLPIYLAGSYSLNTRDPMLTGAYILTVYNGNPLLMIGRTIATISDTNNVMMARAEDRSEDMLMIGGDWSHEPFTVFKRS